MGPRVAGTAPCKTGCDLLGVEFMESFVREEVAVVPCDGEDAGAIDLHGATEAREGLDGGDVVGTTTGDHCFFLLSFCDIFSRPGLA